MNRKLRTAVGVAAVLLIAVAFLLARLDGGPARLDGGGPVGEWVPAAEAARHVGERRTVCGEVASTRYLPSVDGEPTFLNLGRPYPNQVFTVLVWGDDRPRFDRPPEERFRDRRICVTATIRKHRGTPQVIVRRPEQIEIVEEQGPGSR